ncbi:MAG: hypothetical protein KF775_05590 [Cyclobacteriaceae bacterium]|nr:hypothetical protein [Cyclobacteriaceae bacterium]
MYRLVAVVILVVGMASGAVAQSILPGLIQTTPQADRDKVSTEINQFITRLNNKRTTLNDQAFLQLIFSETHRRFLKTYKPYAQFADVFQKAQYDCLSATSLLAVVLDAFGFDFTVVETNYHIFISVQTTNGQVLLESTDRQNGFVTNALAIEQRISTYQQNKPVAYAGNKVYYEFDLNLYQVVQPQQLAGLLLFNQAIVAFNEGDVPESARKLKAAVRIYDSPRTNEFAAILITAIVNSQMPQEEKVDLIRSLYGYINRSVAAR